VDWFDNFLGLFMTDTKRQQEMLEYINSLPYDFITLVGHSKGGNYAQYIAALCDKVVYSVSMDGQGFFRQIYQRVSERYSEECGKDKEL